jgi:hypothetical protein
MMFHSTTMEIGGAVSDAFAKVGRDDAHVPPDQADLTAVILLVAIGLLLTEAFTASFWAEIGQILAVSG